MLVETQIEVWPRSFTCAAQAVGWADGYLIACGEKNLSQLGGEVRARNRRTEPPHVDENGNLVTGERMRDLAETISVTLRTIQNPQGALYRHIYGRNKRTIEVADQIAHRVWDGPARGKTIAKMRDMAMMAVEDHKRRTHTRGRVPVPQMAESINVEWDEFLEVWLPYLRQMREVIKDWLEQADRALTQELMEKRIL